MFATGETMGLVEWIIHDTCLVLSVLLLKVKVVNIGTSLPVIQNPEKEALAKDLQWMNRSIQAITCNYRT